MLLLLTMMLLPDRHATHAPAATPQSEQTCSIIQTTSSRNVHTHNTWDMGIIPYRFDEAVIQDNRDRTREVMDEIESWADISFVPYTGSEPNWITVRNSPAGQGNSASVGQQPGGVVNIVLWESKGMILHELMHTLGFLHEQSRADRDAYIELNDCAYANGNYNIAPDLPTIGPYDFDSVTHYTPLWGCNNEEAYTIRDPYYDHYQSSVGTWHYNYQGPSNGDIWSLYTLYGGEPVPGPFRYTSPPNESTLQQAPAITLSWQPSGLAVSYFIEIDRSPIFRFPLRQIETSGTQIEVAGLEPGSYYWRVGAENIRGQTYPHPKPDDIWSFSIACNRADLATPFGSLDYFDISAFIEAFGDQSPNAELNADGQHTFFDVSMFLVSYSDGCPNP